MEAAQRERVLTDYLTPGHPTAFSAPATVAKFHNISVNKARKYLEHAHAYTLHREYKSPPKYNPIYVHRRRKEVQADLIDIGKIAATNDGVRFLILYIDIFTKKIWVQPIRNKSAAVMGEAVRRWLNSLRTPPKIFKTDRGLEFRNALVQQALNDKGVEWQDATGTLKACIAERANKTLQNLIYKYMTSKETPRYIDKLPALVRTYNTRGHRTLKGMTPSVADQPGSEARVQAIFAERYEKAGRSRAANQRKARFKVGDLVRLKTEASKVSSSTRAYAQQFHGEYYRVVRINRTLPIPMYYLRSLDTQEIIRGAFYGQELQRQRGDAWLVEKVLRRENRRGVPYMYVKWMWFGPEHNSWIPASAVTQRF